MPVQARWLHPKRTFTSGCFSRIGSPDGIEEANPNWTRFGNEINKTARPTLEVVDEKISMPVALITAGQNSGASHLGLALESVFLRTLKDEGLIAARSFALDVGSQSIAFPRRGSLILGGYDRSSFIASSTSYPVTESLNDRSCPFKVFVTDISLSVPINDMKTNVTA